MSFFGKNLKKLRTFKKLSQSAFAELFELNRGNISAYEEERAEAKIDTIIAIAKYFSISIDSLLTKELTINEIARFDLRKSKLITAIDKKDNESLISKKELIPVVEAGYQIEYIDIVINNQNKESLPFIKLPAPNLGNLTAFEYPDNELNYGAYTFQKGDLLICKKVEKKIDSLTLGDIFAIILKNKIIIRRLIEITPQIILSTDNPDSENYSIDFNDILEIWTLKSFYTTHIYHQESERQKIYYLEKELKKYLNTQ